MTISTLGEAANARWRVYAQCGDANCRVHEEIPLRALLWSKGRAMPMSLLPERLRCPVCGCREVRVTWMLPSTPRPKEESHNRYRIEQIDTRGEVVSTLYRDRFAAALECFDEQVSKRRGGRFVFRDGGRTIKTWPARRT
jgi:hypothetical protein